MAERPKPPPNINLAALADPKFLFDLKTAESPEERASRLRREEAEETHKRLIALIVHIFVIAVVGLAFLMSADNSGGERPENRPSR